MEKSLVFLFALTAIACSNFSQTEVVQEERCKQENGGFVPGHGIITCDLYDKEGQLIESLRVNTPEKLHCHPQATYVKCLYVDNDPILPETRFSPCAHSSATSPNVYTALQGKSPRSHTYFPG